MFKSFFGSSTEIPILRLSGVIGQAGMLRSGLTLNSINKLIDKLFSNKKSPAVAIIINSPGGSPTQSSLIAERILVKSKEKNKKVIAFVEDVAASGGYWLACAADEIYVDQNSIVGSIGVISPGFGFVQLIKKLGIERRVYTSGKSKSFLDPFKQAKPEDIKRLKKNKDKEIFSGLFWVGNKALELGLVDGIGHLNGVLKNKFGDKIKIKMIEQKKSFIQRKLSSSITSSLIDSERLIEYLEEKAYWSRYGL